MLRIKKAKQASQLRIIGGKWRGRKIFFEPIMGLRPTPDRVRETVFNWLRPTIINANCIDLFAGSGALGFEALSQGAKHITLIEQAEQAVLQLKENATRLNAKQAQIIKAKLPEQFPLLKKVYDIVFMDPPFQHNLIEPVSHLLEENNLLSENAYIYVEAELSLNPLPTPKNWQQLRAKRAGNLAYYLLQRQNSNGSLG